MRLDVGRLAKFNAIAFWVHDPGKAAVVKVFDAFIDGDAGAAMVADPEPAAATTARVGIVLGIISSVFLGLALLMFGIYLYFWLTGQYPVGGEAAAFWGKECRFSPRDGMSAEVISR